MAGNILTPVAIWGGFKTDVIPECTVIDKKDEGNLSVIRAYIDGRMVKNQRVKIFVTITKSIKDTTMPAVVLVQDFFVGYDEKLAKDLAEKGYVAVSVDIAGKDAGQEYYTEYPDIINYANYQSVKDELYTVKKDVVQTCWYEWGCAIRYVIEYLKSQSKITSIGGLGFSESSTALWHVAGFDKSLSCVAFAMNAGWIGYRGIYKYGGQVEPQFSDNAYKFLAGVEPQAYATHVKCPTLVLSATNSNEFDCDRVCDTLSRIDKDVYTAVHYSVGYTDRASGKGYNDVLIFFDEFLKNGGQKGLPIEPEIKMEFASGKAIVTVNADDKNLKELCLYVAEGVTDPAKRSWVKLSKPTTKTEEGYVFEYCPYHESAIVTAFARVEYKKGFVIGSAVVCKKFKEEEAVTGYKSKVVYSSRTEGGESIFTASRQSEVNPFKINLSPEKPVQVLKGPMDMPGAYSKWGLLTFKINAEKDKPNADAMFMFDCYVKEDNEITVKLISDYFGNKTEYVAKINVLGGEVWHNVKLEKSKFKTEEGMSLKSYDKVNAIEFNANGKWLINNVLWV
ncbi:MAG: hypothetical protein IJX16_05000 [Clostridia bacterium]|nr:hypothetical protein [Clostridia bacterium]